MYSAPQNRTDDRHGWVLQDARRRGLRERSPAAGWRAAPALSRGTGLHAWDARPPAKELFPEEAFLKENETPWQCFHVLYGSDEEELLVHVAGSEHVGMARPCVLWLLRKIVLRKQCFYKHMQHVQSGRRPQTAGYHQRESNNYIMILSGYDVLKQYNGVMYGQDYPSFVQDSYFLFFF